MTIRSTSLTSSAAKSLTPSPPSLPPAVASWIESRFIGDTTETYATKAVVRAEDGSRLREYFGIVTEQMRPTVPQAIVVLLTRLAAHYWSEKGESQWRIVLEDYARDLQKYPLDLIEQGITRYRASGKFWPKVSELIEKIEPLYRKRKLQHARLAKLCGVDLIGERKPDYLDCLRTANRAVASNLGHHHRGTE